MLVSFTVENWMSFRDPVTFSMVASKERQHGGRVPRIDAHSTKVLPIAAIYGGNASGKSNFVKALKFAKSFVVDGTRDEEVSIPVRSFRLNKKIASEPSRFKFEILIGDIVYEFSFMVNRTAVLEEKLVSIDDSGEKTLYDRQSSYPNFGDSLQSEEQRLSVVFQGTRKNQLFLTNAVSQQVNSFRPVYDWFKTSLVLIAPDATVEPLARFFDENADLSAAMREILPQFDTGILRLAEVQVPLASVPFPRSLIEKHLEAQKEGTRLHFSVNDRPFVAYRQSNKVIVKKLVTYHATDDDTEVSLNFNEESDGSRRVIDLLPVFIRLMKQGLGCVFVIDEIDRSLHTLLIRRLVEMYLNNVTPDSRSQLLMTTHDVLLMDQTLLRRDEMWVAERDSCGASTLYSFGEFKGVRYDKDIRKSYLLGRLGGIPRLSFEYGLPRDLPAAKNRKVKNAPAK